MGWDGGDDREDYAAQMCQNVSLDFGNVNSAVLYNSKKLFVKNFENVF